jgi:HPt (histidine-containing phosphotransfer) domain-containing protein
MDRPAQPTSQQEADLTQALESLWVRFLPQIEERVAVLASAVSAVAEKRLTAAECEAAHSAAHKLAGVLATFGLTRGTDLARELETAFSGEAARVGSSVANLAQSVTELRTLIENRRAAPAS